MLLKVGPRRVTQSRRIVANNLSVCILVHALQHGRRKAWDVTESPGLAMWMRIGASHSRAFVLEDLDVIDIREGGSLLEQTLPSFDDTLDLRGG